MTKKRFGARHVVLSLVVLAALVTGARRGAANAPPGRYTITNGGASTGTVLDTVTGLTWQQNAPPPGYSQAEALAYCANNTGGLPGTGWRLPSMQELQTIVDDSQVSPPTIDPNAFPGTVDTYFWTSTPSVSPSGYAWHVHFKDGSCLGAPVTVSGYGVRCVR